MQNSFTGTFSLKKITAVALLVAVGTIAAPFSIPVGAARVYPVQHAINVFMGVIFGPGPAAAAAFLTSILRNIMGTGTLLAFPGSIFGALMAGLAYRFFKRDYLAAAGEILGTGLLGAMAAFPLAKWILGFAGAAYFYIVPFSISSFTGAVIGVVILRLLKNSGVLNTYFDQVN